MATILSNELGLPPLCTWPKTVYLKSKSGKYGLIKLQTFAAPPNSSPDSQPGYNLVQSVVVSCFVAIEDYELYDDELFVRYCIAKSRISLSRVLGAFDYNLPGGIKVNTSQLRQDGEAELAAVMEMINGENTPSYFLQWN